MAPAKCKYCESCGQPLLPETGLGLSPTQWRIYEVLKRRPDISVQALRLAVWTDDDGGREYRTLKAQIQRMNKRLQRHGLIARPNRNGGPEPTWRIYRTETAPEAAA